MNPKRAAIAALALTPALALAACTPAPGPSEAKSEAKSAAEPSATAPASDSAPAPTADPGGEGVSSDPPAPSGPVALPPWFSPEAFDHVQVVKHDAQGTRLPSGELSAMLVLELSAGTTPEQCIEQARAKLGESVSDLPAATTTPQGYLQLQGKSATYGYTVVCGMAKDKPTMFLSFIQ